MMMNFLLSEHFECFMNLPNDEEKVKYTLRFLSKEGRSLSSRQEPKSAEKATEYIEKANKKFSSEQWKSVLETYTQAVVYAPPESNELARAFGNRSAALYEGELYKDSILDIERALNIGYPDNTKAKLYARKAKCLLALNHKMSSEVEEALAEAHNWLAKMNDANKKYMNNVLSKIPINLGSKKSFQLDRYKFFSQIPNDNPKIIGASAAIEIQYSEKFGRHIVATRDIDSGETLLVHKAYASVIEQDSLLKYCWNCSRRAWAGVPCHECVTVIYCSESCRDIAWHDYHNIECPVISAISGFDLQRKFLVLRLTVKAYKEAGTIAKLREKLNKIDAIQDPVTKSHSNNIFDHTKYASVYTLLREPASFLEAIRCTMILYFLATKTDILGERITSFYNLSINQSAIFLGKLILRHYDICTINCFETSDIDDYGKIFGYGYSMNPLINLYNHSCDPMACLVRDGDVLGVVAIERIKKGAQIYIEYGVVFWDNPIEKRREQLKPFRFKCECRACVGNWGPHSHVSFPSHKISSADSEFISFKMRQGFSDLTTITMSIAEIHSLIKKLSNLMNIHQRATQYPTQQMVVLKKILFPLYAHIGLKFI